MHTLPGDLKEALVSDKRAMTAWGKITPLAKNEWICWVISVKKEETRKEHIERAVSELKAGMKRPCCWMGCVHRKDKKLSATQKWILEKKAKKK